MWSVWFLNVLAALAAAVLPALPPAGPSLCRSGPALLVPTSVAGVPLDRSYAAMFAIGNRFVFDSRYSPPSASGRQTQQWRETCEVARIERRGARLTATWVCKRSGKGLISRQLWSVDRGGLATPAFWPCSWSSDQPAVTRPPRSAVSPPVVDDIPYGWGRFSGQALAPNGQSVPTWSLTSSGGSGAGTDCQVTAARDLGVVSWSHSFGADDMYHEGLSGELVDCSGPPPVTTAPAKSER